MNFYFFMKVKGSSQGPFKSEKPHGRDGWLLCYRYGFKGIVQDDPSRGAGSAARSHEPLRVSKGWDVSSPQLMQAFWNNEVLTEVVLEFVMNDGTGSTDKVLERITLTSATIVSVDRVAGERSDRPIEATAAGSDGSTGAPAFFEEIGFRFEAATHENVSGKTMARYDWMNRK